MDIAEVEAVFAEHWRPGFGSVAAPEVMCMQELIREHRPRHFLEIGTASGLSAGLLARVLAENGGESLTTLDHDNTFFGDTTKENGFLVESIYPEGPVAVEKRPFTTSLDLPTLDRRFEMAFVDANHQHPWPIIDTLCIFPFLDGPKVLFHHDLKLFREQEVPFGLGPKYLWDQVPEKYRRGFDVNRGNLFLLELTMDKDELEALASDAFRLPWTLRHPMPPKIADRVREVLATYYGQPLQQAFEDGLRRFNVGFERQEPAPAAAAPAAAGGGTTAPAKKAPTKKAAAKKAPAKKTAAAEPSAARGRTPGDVVRGVRRRLRRRFARTS